MDGDAISYTPLPDNGTEIKVEDRAIPPATAELRLRVSNIIGNSSQQDPRFKRNELLSFQVAFGTEFEREAGGRCKAHSTAKDIVRHAQTRFCLGSLSTKIVITLVGVEDMNESFLASSAHLDHFALTGTTRRLINMEPKADLVAYLGPSRVYPNAENDAAGMASTSIVCDADENVYVGGITAADIKHSINEHGNSVSVTGTILAHELGHNLGI